MTDPTTEADVARFMGRASQIMLAYVDDDEEQLKAIVNADVTEAVLSLLTALGSLGVAMFGSREAMRAQFAEMALRADIVGIKVEP